MAKFFVLGRADVLGALLERPGSGFQKRRFGIFPAAVSQ